MIIATTTLRLKAFSGEGIAELTGSPAEMTAQFRGIRREYPGAFLAIDDQPYD